jgi:protein-S-isoprenylcysteine O-methyltransferase Ste14
LFALPYIFFTLKYKGAHRYEIGDYAILSIVGLKSLLQWAFAKILHKERPRYKLYKNRRVKKVLLLYLVNFFFLTLMARFIIQEFHGFEHELQKIFSQNFSHLHWYNQYKTSFLLLFHLLFTIDVGIAIIGYAFASRWLLNRTRSVDQTLSGWMVALICSPPINTITTQFFGYTGLPTHNLFSDERILAAILTIVIVLYFIYVWATVALGFKFSNLTNRGIVDRGPYAVVRHPAYVAKNSAWWVDNTFVLTNIWATLALAVWNIIYILRGLTEERHLAHDREYREYQQKVKYKFIPKMI